MGFELVVARWWWFELVLWISCLGVLVMLCLVGFGGLVLCFPGFCIVV